MWLDDQRLQIIPATVEREQGGTTSTAPIMCELARFCHERLACYTVVSQVLLLLVMCMHEQPKLK